MELWSKEGILLLSMAMLVVGAIIGQAYSLNRISDGLYSFLEKGFFFLLEAWNWILEAVETVAGIAILVGVIFLGFLFEVLEWLRKIVVPILIGVGVIVALLLVIFLAEGLGVLLGNLYNWFVQVPLETLDGLFIMLLLSVFVITIVMYFLFTLVPFVWWLTLVCIEVVLAVVFASLFGLLIGIPLVLLLVALCIVAVVLATTALSAVHKWVMIMLLSLAALFAGIKGCSTEEKKSPISAPAPAPLVETPTVAPPKESGVVRRFAVAERGDGCIKMLRRLGADKYINEDLLVWCIRNTSSRQAYIFLGTDKRIIEAPRVCMQGDNGHPEVWTAYFFHNEVVVDIPADPKACRHGR